MARGYDDRGLAGVFRNRAQGVEMLITGSALMFRQRTVFIHLKGISSPWRAKEERFRGLGELDGTRALVARRVLTLC
jgi:hypothetical protein